MDRDAYLNRESRGAYPGPPPTKKPAECEHLQFVARVDVNRLTDTGRFTTDCRVWCSDCGEPFRWLGVAGGSSPYEPLASIDGLELRAPIEPQGTPALLSGARFVMPPMPLRGGGES